MALPVIVLDPLRQDVRESQSLATAAERVGVFAQQESMAALEALLDEPSLAEAAVLAARASDNAALLGAEVQRFLSLLPHQP